MDKKLKFFCVLILLGIFIKGQVISGFQSARERFKIPFTEVNNLIIIPVTLNETTQLNMILDSGSPYTLLLELDGVEEITINKGKEIKIGGLGHGYDLTAYDSRFNHLKIGKATKEDTNLLVLLDSPIDLNKFLGIPVHGVIGYDILKDFVVEINYRSNKIKFYQHDYFYQKKKKKNKKTPSFPAKIL